MLKLEIERRIEAFRKALKESGLSGALLFFPLNIYYFTGHFVKGVLWLNKEEVRLYVKRPLKILEEEKNFPFSPLESLKGLSKLLEKGDIKRIGVDFRAFNYEDGKRLEGLLSPCELISIDDLIWKLRMIKSDFEIECLRKASLQLSKALKESLNFFKLGMKEIEASALLEKCLRERGHPGFTRSFNNFELTFGYLISGKEGLYPLPFTTGEGGQGVPGFPGGATFKKLKKGEPILMDFSGFWKGYYVDQSRMASFGKCKEAEPFFRVSLEILTTLEKKITAEMPAEEVYLLAHRIVERYGFQEYFMRHGEKMSFIGHGVGLEIDEPPVLAYKNKMPLKENMAIALEPKFHIPELGVVGLEDTYLITSKGLKRLTTFPRQWVYLS